MSHGARVCGHCGAVNSAQDSRCHRCSRWMPGPNVQLALDAYDSTFGREYPLTKVLVAVCGVVYLLSTLEYGQIDWLRLPVGVARRWGALTAGGALEPWRYVTANFLHFGLAHFGLNMMMLVSFGRAIEERLGAGRMAVVFVGCGALGFLASDLTYRFEGARALTGGASSGVAALIGAFVGFAFAQRNPVWKRVMTAVVLYGVLFAVVLPMQGINVNHSAHVGGFASGALAGLYFHRELRRPRRASFVAVGGALMVLAVLAIAAVRLSAP